MPKKLLMGNEAAAYAALEAGVRVVAGYPGTPSSEVVETVARLRAQGVATGVHVEWSTNEKAALELAFGASLSGARALFTCKQMGLNVASDALLSLNYVGVRGGLVLYVADDPGPISSQTEQDTRRFAAFAKVPVLDPANPDQLYQMMLEAFELSERFGTPVILRPTTRICHASTFFDVPEQMVARAIPEEGFEKDDSRWVIFPARSFRAHKEINDRLATMAHEFSGTADASSSREATGTCAAFNPFEQVGEQPTIGIVAGGVTTAYVREALALLEAQGAALPAYRFMQVGTPYPFPEEAALRFAEGLERVLVCEELDYVLEDEFLKLAGRHHVPLTIQGKIDGTTANRGENSVESCFAVLRTIFALEPAASEASAASDTSSSPVATLDPPVRPPVLCAGCPHRGSFYAVKTALRKHFKDTKYVLCGDIGCYTLGNAKPLNAVDTCLCMGAGITMAQGIAAVEPGRKALAFIGDSTFFASGLTGVANAVYNQHDITICILDNATTAMTGSQPHPGTGVTLMGSQSEPIGIEASLRALGVTCITRANPFDLDQAEAAAHQAIAFEGPSAIIFEGPCIQLSQKQPAVVVDEDACTGCLACVKAIGCPALSAAVRAEGDTSSTLASNEATASDAAATGHERRVMRVDTSLCWGCNLCTYTCPFGALHPGASPDSSEEGGGTHA